ncbi:MAG TPA: hypothetical protein DHU55_07480 [Blastocatellia bacterium]|nr:hypothetical protein [Blastocatellia bacterium]
MVSPRRAFEPETETRRPSFCEATATLAAHSISATAKWQARPSLKGILFFALRCLFIVKFAANYLIAITV